MATAHLKKKTNQNKTKAKHQWSEGKRRGSQMLSLSRQLLLSTRCWGSREGTHLRDLLFLYIAELKGRTERLWTPYANQSVRDFPAGGWRDFIWRPPLGTAGSLAVPLSFWEAAAYCFGGNSRQGSACQMRHACHFETLTKFILLASVV